MANGKFVSFDVTGAGTSQSTGTFPSRISDTGEIVGETLDSGFVAHGFVGIPAK